MAEQQPKPAPYDWHKASDFKPNPGEIVRVFQLSTWAEWTGTFWRAVDRCGNRMHLAWTPEYWRREYYPADPA